MLTTVRLYGALGREFGRVHRFDIATPAEALRALRAQYPAFARRARAAAGLRIVVDDVDLCQAAELFVSRPARTVRVVPVAAGAAAEIALAVGAMLEGVLGTAAAASVGLFVGQAAVSIGFSLLMGGISQLLFAPPKPDAPEVRERPENKPSYAFDGAVNTVAQGHPVQLLYGRLRVGSQVISAGLYAEEVTP